MSEKGCIFCKIANGEIPSATLYEDEMFRVILDVSPASEGHALILPKQHFENILDMPDEIGAKVLIIAKDIAGKLMNVLKCDGLNILQNNGSKAGQTVFHFHMHLIPRYDHDDVQLGWTPGSLSDTKKEEILKAFVR